MLRGTNRSIIEISETDNRYFERVLIFVKPEFGHLPLARLEKEASLYVGNMNPIPTGLNRYQTARGRAVARRKKRLALIGVGLALATLLIFVMKIF